MGRRTLLRRPRRSAISVEKRERSGPVVTQQMFRDAMARLGAAVNVITTDGPGGRRGFTASAVCSVTDSPPTLLVCMNRTSDSNEAVRANGVLCVNTLTARQQELSPLFAGQYDVDMEGRFAAAGWGSLVTGAPVLQDAAVSFDCKIAQTTAVGTHHVFFCEVQAIQFGSVHEGLIYYGRTYHPVRIS
ncbi:MAG TPA: flavin reductase [Acetobacteraceae bacterium]|nr:flavin reductase [Acetobacteraceae bacterium]